jgi:hypothetical protein
VIENKENKKKNGRSDETNLFKTAIGKELLLNLTSFTAIYTVLVYFYTIGTYSFYGLPSVYYAFDSSMLLSNGTNLLLLGAILFLLLFFLYEISNKFESLIFNSLISKKIISTMPIKVKKIVALIVGIIMVIICTTILIGNAKLIHYIVAFTLLYLYYLLKQNSFIHSFAGLVIMGLSISIASYYYGFSMTQTSEYHTILNDGQEEYIIIREYNNYYVTTHYRRENNSFEKSFELIPINTKGISLQEKHIGHLKINE